jgi:hypothetical protein
LEIGMHEYDLEDKKENAISEIRRIAQKIGKTPTIVEYKRESPSVGSDSVIGLFGAWNEAMQMAGLEINPTRQPPRNDYSKDEIVQELIKIANECGSFPSHTKFNSLSSMSRGPVERCFGSWVKAREYIFSNHTRELTFVPNHSKKKINSFTNKSLGISCALVNVPRNEMETIVLFSILAEEMGYKIHRAQVEYPDLLVERDGKLLDMEVEYVSSNYLNHGHPLNQETLCLCWRKDRDIEGIEIIDLESYIRTR